MIEEINGEIYEYDFYGFENSQAAEEIEAGKFRDIENGRTYVVNGLCDLEEHYTTGGLGNWDSDKTEKDDFAEIGLDLSFFGFKSQEMVNHFIKYFGKIAFDSVYGQFKQYEWL